jgi:hypothetical protein
MDVRFEAHDAQDVGEMGTEPSRGAKRGFAEMPQEGNQTGLQAPVYVYDERNARALFMLTGETATPLEFLA